MNAIVLLLLLATLALYSRVWLPWGEGPSGNLVRVEPLAMLGRLRMFGPGVAIILLATLLALGLGLIGVIPALLVLILALALFVIPYRYTITSGGIRAGWTPFRRWTEFGGVARRRGGVRLQGVAGARPQTVWLSGGREDDEFVLLLRQLVRGSYKGMLGPEAGEIPGEPLSAPTSPGPIGMAGAGD